MKKQCILLGLLLPLFAIANPPGHVEFFKGSLDEAKIQASQTGLMYFVHFSADWCMPCQWMEQHTFRDEKLAKYLKSNYIPVKLDVDNPTGEKIKRQYAVKRLPTLLIFSTQGRLIGRFEESMEADQLLKILREYDLPQNKGKIKTQSTTRLIDSPKPKVRISRPALLPDHIPPPPSPKPVRKPLVLTAPAEAPATLTANAEPVPSSSSWTPTEYISTPDWEAPRSVKGFGIQVGVYHNYKNALRSVQEYETNYDHPVQMISRKKRDQFIYMVIIGRFQDHPSAEEFLQIHALEGFVRNIDVLR